MQKKEIKILQQIRDSVYVRWLREHRTSMVISMLIAALLTILTYPGVLYSDSYNRIMLADRVKVAMHAFRMGQTDLTIWGCWLTILPSFLILLCKEITGGIALYTFLQCFCFLMVLGEFTDQLNQRKHPLWNRFWLLLSPVILAYGVYYEAGIGCITAIMVILIVIGKWERLEQRLDRGISCCILVFSSLICFGYRANAFSILPVLFFVVFLKNKKMRARMILLLTIVGGFGMSSLIPGILHIKTMSSSMAAFAWETVTAIQIMDETTQKEYSNYLDDIFGEGATAEALVCSDISEDDTTIVYLFDSSIDQVSLSKPGVGGKLLKKYVQLAVDQPGYFWKMKGQFLSRVLGIDRPIAMMEYDYNRWDRMDEFGYNDTPQRKAFIEYFLAFMGFMAVFRMPWVMYLVSGLLLVLYRKKYMERKAPWSFCEIAYLTALFYYGVFLLNTQSFEFRYFFPAWVLIYAVMIALLAEILSRKARYRTFGMIAAGIVTVVSFGGGYAAYVRSGNEKIMEIGAGGKKLYGDGERALFYYEDRLYIITARGTDNDYPFFLHLITAEGEEENTFSFRSGEIPTSFWKESLAVVDLPKDGWQAFSIGQSYDTTRFWEYTTTVEDVIVCPEILNVSEYSDPSWDRGYHLAFNCFLIQDTGRQYELLVGKGLAAENGAVLANVEKIEEMGGYTVIYTDTALEDHNIRNYQVVMR